MQYDVVIIGAGPAGAACAKELVDNGLKTLVIEKKKLPRYKACAGLLDEKSFEFIEAQFGKLPAELYCSQEKVEVCLSKNGDRFFPVKGHYLHNLLRHKLDRHLINKSGAQILQQTLYLGHENKNGLLNVKIINEQKEYKTLECKYLVGADGGYSKVRRNISPADYPYHLINRQKVYKGEGDIDPAYYYFIRGSFSDIFAYFCMKDDLIYIGSSYFRENRDAGILDELDQFIRERFHLKNLRFLRYETCLSEYKITGRYDINGGLGNVFLAGEAAGLIGNYGKGIPVALFSGNALAAIIAAHYHKPELIRSEYSNKLSQMLEELKKQYL